MPVQVPGREMPVPTGVSSCPEPPEPSVRAAPRARRAPHLLYRAGYGIAAMLTAATLVLGAPSPAQAGPCTPLPTGADPEAQQRCWDYRYEQSKAQEERAKNIGLVLVAMGIVAWLVRNATKEDPKIRAERLKREGEEERRRRVEQDAVRARAAERRHREADPAYTEVQAEADELEASYDLLHLAGASKDQMVAALTDVALGQRADRQRAEREAREAERAPALEQKGREAHAAYERRLAVLGPEATPEQRGRALWASILEGAQELKAEEASTSNAGVAGSSSGATAENFGGPPTQELSDQEFWDAAATEALDEDDSPLF